MMWRRERRGPEIFWTFFVLRIQIIQFVEECKKSEKEEGEKKENVEASKNVNLCESFFFHPPRLWWRDRPRREPFGSCSRLRQTRREESFEKLMTIAVVDGAGERGGEACKGKVLIKRLLLGKLCKGRKKVALENDFSNLLPQHLIKSGASEIRMRNKGKESEKCKAKMRS